MTDLGDQAKFTPNLEPRVRRLEERVSGLDAAIAAGSVKFDAVSDRIDRMERDLLARLNTIDNSLRKVTFLIIGSIITATMTFVISGGFMPTP